MEIIGLQPQFWIVPLIAGVFLVLGVGLWLIRCSVKGDSYMGGEGWGFGAIFSWVIGVILLGVYAFMLIPYDTKYLYNYKLSGTVEINTNKFDDGDGTLSYIPIAKVSGYPDPIRVNDSRLLTLDGKNVDLTCSIKWAYEGMDVTACSVRAIH